MSNVRQEKAVLIPYFAMIAKDGFLIQPIMK